MKKNFILKKYKDKINLYQKYSKFYYDKNKPLVSDEIFDNLKKEILKLEKENIFLKNELSPSFSVGFKPLSYLRFNSLIN